MAVHAPLVICLHIAGGTGTPGLAMVVPPSFLLTNDLLPLAASCYNVLISLWSITIWDSFVGGKEGRLEYLEKYI